MVENNQDVKCDREYQKIFFESTACKQAYAQDDFKKNATVS